MTTSHDPQSPREAMVTEVLACGFGRRPCVEQALRAVPRHQFIPEATTEHAYAAHTAFVTKRSPDGASLSSASAPTVVALMLDQLDVRPGQRVLEIGSGTGYNAALLAELTGPDGEVVTLDIDHDVVARARTALHRSGYSERVTVLAGDGLLGAPGRGRFDRIIVTAGAWDVPPAWTDQLSPGGRLVVPLRWRGHTRAIAFTHHPDQQLLRSDAVAVCGFIPLIGADGEHQQPLDAEQAVTLSYDAEQHIDPQQLVGILDRPSVEEWSGVTVGAREPFDGVWLRLAVTEPGAAWLATDPQRFDQTGPLGGLRPRRTSAVVDGDSMALFRYRAPTTDRATGSVIGSVIGSDAELGALGFGPAATTLTDRVLRAITTWDTDRHLQPVFTLHPQCTPDDQLPAGSVVDKQHRRLVVSYPTP